MEKVLYLSSPCKAASKKLETEVPVQINIFSQATCIWESWTSTVTAMKTTMVMKNFQQKKIVRGFDSCLRIQSGKYYERRSTIIESKELYQNK